MNLFAIPQATFKQKVVSALAWEYLNDNSAIAFEKSLKFIPAPVLFENFNEKPKGFFIELNRPG